MTWLIKRFTQFWASPEVREFLVEFKKSWALPPMWITYARIAGMVFPGLFFLIGHLWDLHFWFLNTPTRWLWAAPITYGLVMATDGLDGWVARRWHWESELGGMLDPLADKGLVILSLVQVCILKLWIYLPMLMIIVREVEVTKLRVRVKRAIGTTMLADRNGKNKAIAQNAAVIALMMPIGGKIWFGVSLALLLIAVGIGFYSWAKYDDLVDGLIGPPVR